MATREEIKEEIAALKKDPEFLAAIKIGVHDAHLGHILNYKWIRGEFRGWFGRRWYCRLAVRLKECWWLIKTPYQQFSHRNCIQCKEFKKWQLEKRLKLLRLSVKSRNL